MNRTICLFEDAGWNNLNPLVYFIPVYELRCGILTIKEKVEKHFSSDKVLLHARRYLAETILGQLYDNILFDPYFSDEWIFINARTIINDNFCSYFSNPSEEIILRNNNFILGAYLKGENAKSVFAGGREFPEFNSLKGVKVIDVKTSFLEHPWDLIKLNGAEISNDYKLIKADHTLNERNYEGVVAHHREHICIGVHCNIEPFVFLNAEKGPIYIGDNVKIYSHSSIEGPAYIGSNSMIKTHSSIYNNTSIGPVSKVGGEIENSIVHSYSNKQHYGFLGHSYIGQWVNLGAGTSNSDLKNNYSPIRVKKNGESEDTGMTFLGALIGDYTKTAIGSRFSTGSLIGPCCNIITNQAVPSYLPPFTWVLNENLCQYDFDKIIETTKIVYARRGIIFTDDDRRLFREVFNYTKSEKG